MTMLVPLAMSHRPAICALDDNENKAALAAMMTKPAFQGLGVEVEDRMIGFIYGWVIDDQGEVIQITVSEDHRQQGLGRRLLAGFIERFDLRSCWLDVKSSNIPALHLYRQFGFVEDGARKGYYQSTDPTATAETAILMQWKR
jgi:ribosomal-protein-alanine N-acetyltransferase